MAVIVPYVSLSFNSTRMLDFSGVKKFDPGNSESLITGKDVEIANVNRLFATFAR